MNNINHTDFQVPRFLTFTISSTSIDTRFDSERNCTNFFQGAVDFLRQVLGNFELHHPSYKSQVDHRGAKKHRCKCVSGSGGFPRSTPCSFYFLYMVCVLHVSTHQNRHGLYLDSIANRPRDNSIGKIDTHINRIGTRITNVGSQKRLSKHNIFIVSN